MFRMRIRFIKSKNLIIILLRLNSNLVTAVE
jgi:hypothetical protein